MELLRKEMPIMTKTKFIDCDCTSNEHIIRFDYDPMDGNQVYLSVQLPKVSFFKRMLAAVKYVLGYQCKYGHWEETLINKNQIEEIIELLVEAKYGYASATKIKKGLDDIRKGKKNTAYQGARRKSLI